MSNRLTRFLTEPLIQFLIIGAAIYGAYALYGTPEEDFRDTTVHVDSNRINAFISEWESRWNRPPTGAELDGLIQNYIREDVLYQQAVEMGLNEDDPITRRRMAQKLEYLTSDLAMMVQPADGELESYFDENKDAYRQPDQVTFIQVYFDPDSRAETTLGDAELALAELRTAGVPNPESLEVGDANMLQGFYQSATVADVARQMGSGFAESVMALEQGEWHGTILSGYGVHLVYVYEHLVAPEPQLNDMRETVLQDWHLIKRDSFNAEFLESLKERYEIVIDPIPQDRILQTQKETQAESAG